MSIGRQLPRPLPGREPAAGTPLPRNTRDKRAVPGEPFAIPGILAGPHNVYLQGSTVFEPVVTADCLLEFVTQGR